MKNKVFFLGAGFSKAISNEYPLMNSLSKQILESLENNALKEHLKDLPEQLKCNIEDLLNYLYTYFPWKDNSNKYLDLALYANIVKKLSDYFIKLNNEPLIKNEIYDNFALSVLDSKSKINFITLNYDLLLEYIILTVHNNQKKLYPISYSSFYPYPLTWIGSRCGEDAGSFFSSAEITNNVPKILKLHGSVNWFWAGNTPSDTIYFSNNNSNEAKEMFEGLNPYIIPPVLDKNSFYNHNITHSLWNQAEQLLKQADEIYIVGFSFPPTDLSVRYLFQTALHGKTPQLYVVNIAKKEELKVYNNVFKGTKVNYDYTGNDNVLERFIKEKILAESSNE